MISTCVNILHKNATVGQKRVTITKNIVEKSPNILAISRSPTLCLCVVILKNLTPLPSSILLLLLLRVNLRIEKNLCRKLTPTKMIPG
ncbi:unnamed protein product [Allacma fusca]|uniref:Uncharacterized protein n=1 Tax=Allacma fusca TaxID=39272 RepID=A0A8J2L802_9HEXA|nr:unnamed protein product [Allacma fusca]